MIIAEQQHIAVMYLTTEEAAICGMNMQTDTIDHDKVNSAIHTYTQTISPEGNYEYSINEVEDKDLKILSGIIEQCPKELQGNIPDVSKFKIKVGIKDLKYGKNNITGPCQVKIIPDLHIITEEKKNEKQRNTILPNTFSNNKVKESYMYQFDSLDNMLEFVRIVGINPIIYKRENEYFVKINTDENTMDFHVIRWGFAALECMGKSLNEITMRYIEEHCEKITK